MKKLIIVALVICLGSCSRENLTADYNVVPLPRSIELNQSEGFKVNDDTRILITDNGEKTVRNADMLAGYIYDITGYRLPIEIGDSNDNTIIFHKTRDTLASEQYKIDIDKTSIRITSHTHAGAFYAIQTLRKAMPVNSRRCNITFPAATIDDQPSLGYRGMMLDVSRSFYGVDSVKRMIDIMALHNLNTFHWHLTDDQGWRIEIKKYPKLTQIGSIRKDTLQGTYGGFYTQEQIRDVVDYAARHYITVIPEVDMPGHMMSVLASYPELGCTGGPYVITDKPGVHRDILCAGNPEAVNFVKDVLTEVMEMFPSKYIHIGGDEAPRDRWQKCPKCQAMIVKQGLKATEKATAEARLQTYFNGEVEKFLNEHSREMIGWDEVLEGGISPQTTVMSWRGTKWGTNAAAQGNKAIMTPVNSLYFNQYQSTDFDNEPVATGGYAPMERVYNTPLVAPELTQEQAANIIGAQACLWSTWVPTWQLVEYMTLPRMAALAELVWNYPTNTDFADLINRMPKMLDIYDKQGYNYSNHLFQTTLSASPDFANKNLRVALNSIKGASIYYTLDGSTPSAKSSLYTDTIRVNKNASVRAIAIMPNGLSSDVCKKEIEFSKATLRPIKAITTPDPRYDALELIDGVRGGSILPFGCWVGFQQEYMEVVIDLEAPTEISQLDFSSMEDYSSWIMAATAAEIAISDNGKTFTEVAREEFAPRKYTEYSSIIDHKLSFEPAKTRYVRIRVKRAKELPIEHLASGEIPFLFIDEISLR